MDCFQPERDITRHERIEILLIQKNAIRQRLKALHSVKINVLPLNKPFLLPQRELV